MAIPATWNEAVLADSGTANEVRTRVAQLVHTHSRHVHAVAYSVLRDHHDAEDVAQDTFLRALRQGESIQQLWKWVNLHCSTALMMFLAINACS
jgi:hypothetical protein